MFVKSKEGLSIIDPVTRTLVPVEGMEVPDGDHYWIRRLRDGDVVEAEKPAAPEAADEGENA
jgi:hypothetical protein